MAQKPAAAGRQAAKNLLLNTLLVLLPLLILEGIFRLLPVSHPPRLLPVTAAHPVVRFESNVDYLYSRDWNFSLRTHRRSNNFGYSNAADYHAEETTPLLMFIGDSFVEGHVVDSGQTAAERLDTALAGRGRVYSIGISGAALSQYLAFAEFSRDTFHPQAMAFAIIGNDFDESLLKYKAEPRLHYFDADGRLRRIDYELPAWKKILRHSALVRYAMLNLEAEHRIGSVRQRLLGAGDAQADADAAPEQRLLDSQQAVDRFLDQLPEKSGLGAGSIVFVVDAARPALYSAEALRQADSQYGGRMRRYFKQQARARGYPVLDMLPVFVDRHRQDGSRFEATATDSHWNELAHRLVAGEVEKSAVFARVFGEAKRINEN